MSQDYFILFFPFSWKPTGKWVYTQVDN
jgi:hypothetical protein